MHTRLIARELKLRGFDTEIAEVERKVFYSNGTVNVSFSAVIVSLKRPISTMEVADALSLSFDEIHFNLTKISPNQVLVEE